MNCWDGKNNMELCVYNCVQFRSCFHSVQHWTDYQLDRTLFTVPTIPNCSSGDCSIFSKLQYTPLENLPCKLVQWLSKASIDMYFGERMAGKGNEKGRRLFMCDFLRSCQFHKANNEIYFRAQCCAEMKKSVEYDVNIHVNLSECAIIKSQCQCPAGIGPGAACKHVSALLYAIEYYAVTGETLHVTLCCSQIYRKTRCRFRKR